MNMTPADRVRLDELLCQLRDEELSAPQLQELEVLVLSNEEARELYIDTVQLRTSLRWANAHHGETAAKPVPSPMVDTFGSWGNFAQNLPLPSWPYSVALLTAFAVVLLIAVYIGPLQLWWQPNQAALPVSAPVALITRMVDCELAESSIQGSDLPVGANLELLAGLAQITFECGTRLHVEGPAALEVLSQNEVYLHHGRLTAVVSPKGIGFTVNTPSTRVIDLGTAFGVHVGPSKTSAVAVFQGAVDVECREPRKPQVAKHRVLEDEMVWINQARELVEKSGSLDSFLHSLLASAEFKTLLKLDFTSEETAPLEPGFSPYVVPSEGLDVNGLPVRYSPVTHSFGDLRVTLRGTSANLCPRDRKHVSYGNDFPQADLLRDMVFASSGGESDKTGLDIVIDGLTPHREYIVTIWSSDIGSEGTRVSDWKANGTPVKDDYAFSYEVFPKSSAERRFSFAVKTDAAGTILIEARRDVSCYVSRFGKQPGVFLNGLQLLESASSVKASSLPANALVKPSFVNER